jgi:PKD repeat protein
VLLIVTDAAGASGSVTHPVAATPPAPTVTLSASPQRVPVGRPTALAATTDGGAAPLQVAWSFGDGTTATGAFQKHVYRKAGTYVVRVTGTDALGRAATAAARVVAVPGPAVVIDIAPQSILSGAPARVTAHALTAVGRLAQTRIVAWRWTFDGKPSKAGTSSLTHVFAAGRHVVGVEVVDASGRTGSATLTVAATPPPTTISVVDIATVTDGVSGPAEIDVSDNAGVTDGVSGPAEIDVSDNAGIADGVSGPVVVSTLDGASVTDTVSSKTKPRKRR